MTQLSNKVLDTIKEKHVTPAPRWQFMAKNYAMWTAFAISVALGSISFGVIADRVARNDWDIYLYLDKSFLGFLLIALPYIWIVSLLAFALLAYYNCRHTKCGYRFAPYVVIIASVGSSLIIGEILYVSGAGHYIDCTLSHSMPFYKDARIKERRTLWMNPEKGLLMGEVTDIGDDGMLMLRDANGVTWQIRDAIGHVPIPHPKAERSIVKVIGKPVDGVGDEFFARDVRLCDCEEELSDGK